jgi:hypothetical protein
VLVTNCTLAGRSGTELYVRDLALELRRQGDVPVVYTPDAGPVAAELAAQGIRVLDRLEDLEEPPDLIQGHHAHPTLIALLRMPGTPAFFLCHDARAWHDEPPVHPRIRRHAAVDFLCRERVVRALGLPEERVRVLLNFVDLDRFPRGPERPAKPRRALVFSNAARAGSWSDVVVEACRARGLTVDLVGWGSGRMSVRPEDLLAGYDVVFAKAKAALESMAVGAAVVLCDEPGLGPLVTAEAFDRLRPFNFGRALLTEPHTVAAVHTRLDAYDPRAAAAVSAFVRARCGLPEAVREIRALHAEVVEEHARLGPTDPDEEQAAVARFLEGLNAGNPLARAAVLSAQAVELQAEVARLEGRVREQKERYVDRRLGARIRRALRRLRGEPM